MSDRHSTVASLFAALKGDKIKERQEAASQIRQYFSSDRAIDKIGKNGDGKEWLILFEHVFESFAIEKRASTKNGKMTTVSRGAAAQARKRMGELSQLLRFLVWRTASRLTGKAVKMLLENLYSQLRYHGELIENVSLYFIKTTEELMKWKPHVNRLEDATWVKLVELCFNIILEDPLKTRLEDELGEDVLETSPMQDTTLDDPMADDDDSMIVDEEPSSSRKRRFVETPQKFQPSHRSQSVNAYGEYSNFETSHVASQEQIAAVRLLRILLTSPTAPFMSSFYPFLPAAILNRLQRFLDMHFGSSMQNDYIEALSAVLSHLTLNTRNLVVKFARTAWSGLVSMWGMKEQNLKEQLTIVLKMLFPYYTLENGLDTSPGDSSVADGVGMLWRSLEATESSRGVGGLSLESLRLNLCPQLDADSSPFVTSIFQHGYHFDEKQALAWAILELQADCAEKLYQLSETIHPLASLPGKRKKVENPVTNILNKIMHQPNLNVRIYHLQLLLFIIARHWGVLYDTLQADAVQTLLQFLSFDDASVQSWCFMCFAVMAHANATGNLESPIPSLPSSSADNGHWDVIWAHAMRRSNVPAVCRAACHVAHILLYYSKSLLSPQRMLGEIEAFAKDLSVQGPSFPYDSVCSLMVLCLRIASQDVRLYRMAFEDKALTWLTDSWRPGTSTRKKLPLHTVADILNLLNSIRGSGRSADLLCEMQLPDAPIINAITEEHATAIIRDFQLYAHLPPFKKPAYQDEGFAEPDISKVPRWDQPDRVPVMPQEKERRVSAYFLKTLDDLSVNWKSPKETFGHFTAEMVRTVLDFSVTALAFEATLSINGTQTNRRVIQAACRILTFVTPQIVVPQWTITERAMMVSAFEPLVFGESQEPDVPPWETFLPPEEGSGIRTEVLRSLTRGYRTEAQKHTVARRALQRAVFQSSDVQDTVVKILQTMRDCLRLIISQLPDQSKGQDLDDLDIRVADQPDSSTSQSQNSTLTASRAVTRTVEICISSLAVCPALQSASGEATRDRELLDIVLGDNQEAFLLLAPSYLRNVRQGTLTRSASSLEALFDQCESFVGGYTYIRDPRLHLLVIHLLRSALPVWVTGTIAEPSIAEHANTFCAWLVKVHLSDKLTSVWQVRDCFVRFLDEYIAADPKQNLWPVQADKDPVSKPSQMLPEMGTDGDVRVRFRAAISNARIFRLAYDLGQTAPGLYENIRKNLTKNTHEYERMLSRFICLGNLMVVSSVVRRGPYWHLLEACFYASAFTDHIEAILNGVAARLGFPRSSTLFELYAGQIAYSIRKAGMDFLRFPSRLLGYKERKQCAEAAFIAFSPRNLLELGSDLETIAHGRRLFTTHCRILQKTTTDGLRECFAEVIGYNIVYSFEGNTSMDGSGTGPLLKLIHAMAQEIGVTNQDLLKHLRREAVGIVIAIIRTLSDLDVSSTGSVFAALSETSPAAAQEFTALNTYRALHSLQVHEPNLPLAPAARILEALDWLHGQIPVNDDAAITYHVLHRLFAELERSLLVNEQMRLLSVVCLWVAYHHEQFNDKSSNGSTLLRTLSRAAANLMSQFDLIRGAQSILQWVLSRMRQETGLTELLIRVACTAYDWSTNAEEEFARTGNDILQWIEMQAFTLSQNAKFRSSIQQAISAWPRDLSSTLREIAQEPSGKELSSILADKRISSNKFRLVRQLRQLATDGLYDASQFAKSDFWRLKEFIPVAQHLSASDIDSFAQLLFHQNGFIDGLECDYKIGQSMLEMHMQEERETTKADLAVAPQRAIMTSLLTDLSASSTTKVHLAFVTLRSILSVRETSPGGTRPWSLPHDAELTLLKPYPHPPSARSKVDLQELLDLEAHSELVEDFSRWVRFVTTALTDHLATADSFYGSLAYILQEDADFAEEVLPLLVHTILRMDAVQQIQTRKVILSSYFSQVLRCELSTTPSRRAILNTVLHLRNFDPPGGKSVDPLAYDLWLTIDFVLLSRNAIQYGAYTTALLFLELAVEHGVENISDQSSVEQVLYNIYDHIDEPDGFYGIQTQNLHQFLLKSFRHENQWDKAFRFHGAAMEASTVASTDTQGLLQAIHSFGFDRLAMTTLQGTSGIDDQVNSSSMVYSLGWRTETWDLPEQNRLQNAGTSLYLALRAVNRERDPRAIDSVVERVIVEEMQALRSLGNENLTEIRAVAQNLMCLEQVRRWSSPEVQQCLRAKTLQSAYSEMFCKINDGMEFSDIEAIMATRIALLRSVRRQEQRQQLGDLLTPFTEELVDLETRSLLSLSAAARKAGRGQVALNAVVHAQKLPNLNLKFDVSREFANVLWMMDEPMSAMQFLQNARTALESTMTTELPEDKKKKALVYALLGTWASEACLEKPTYIKSEFFDPAASFVNDLRKVNNGGQNMIPASVYHDYAIFSERQYHAITRAPDLLRWKILVDRKTLEVNALEERLKHYSTSRNTQEYNQTKTELDRSRKILDEDVRQYEAHSRTRDVFLEHSIEMHSRSLATSNEFDDESAIRLCSLWFANFEYTQGGVQSKVFAALRRVPSYKFVFLTHQLSARLSKPQTAAPPGIKDCSQIIWDLMIRMCREHPFHCLYSVYCLRSDMPRSRRHSTRNDPASSQVERAAAAVSIFKYLRSDPQSSSRVIDIERVCDASLHWAKYPIKGIINPKSKGLKVPPDIPISKLRNVAVPVITAHTPLDPSRRYDNCVWIHRYEQGYSTAGGLSMPKILGCLGSDGRRYKQLFKGEGEDDLRQDAVMEQVFELVNVVLRRDRDTLRRDLHIMTYKVIPMASQAGVIEFVGDTTQLTSWLPNAHRRYAPAPKGSSYDKWDKIAPALHSLRTSDDETRIAAFKEVCAGWKPVMRHYFTEQHKDPMPWFRIRLHYARSVAATSIVGHILGLGDRHLSNILIHNESGEVVHVDLGIAFEQGKLLPLPERVPFRLTRDMVDGLGTSGTKGVFQRCAEETLRVLRDGSEVILTVLEVFKHDPLHSWTASELKMKQVQSTTVSENPTGDLTTEAIRFVAGLDMSAGVADEAADRALSTVVRKLDKGLSVQFTVNELIAEATDLANLGLMFNGWSPWC